ncbi:MAG: DUF86 domain-containing protein [Sulfuricaulis sp.]|nr:DUF86 domain-containing protein [Sulfuricaulis sp.]
MSRDWLLYLDDIAQGAGKILRYISDLSFEEFCANDVIFDAVLFNLQVIGEAAKKLPDAVKVAVPGIEWSDAAKFRDIIAHHYFALDAQIVWDVARNRVPEIRDAAQALLARFGEDGNE